MTENVKLALKWMMVAVLLAAVAYSAHAAYVAEAARREFRERHYRARFICGNCKFVVDAWVERGVPAGQSQPMCGNCGARDLRQGGIIKRLATNAGSGVVGGVKDGVTSWFSDDK